MEFIQGSSTLHYEITEKMTILFDNRLQENFINHLLISFLYEQFCIV